jgi:hypothetical protein
MKKIIIEIGNFNRILKQNVFKKSYKGFSFFENFDFARLVSENFQHLRIGAISQIQLGS